MKTNHIFYCIFCVLMFAACSGGDYERQLERFEEMNRTDVPLCVDSVQPLVRHYDHWWHSPNHRMRAYYMLGCAYRDQGEAPAAIHYYNIAAEQADTASSECDYATLFRVYGQMAMIYGQQNMPQEELEAWKGYSHYSFLAGDTINGALGYVYIARAHYAMDDTLAVLHFTDKARRLYLEHGDKEGAARVYPTAIYISLLNGNYPRARKFMDIFEGESNLFDETGNIAPGREQYYNSKGLYCIGTGKLDSAEYYFRKLLPYGYNLEACEGLLSIYENRRNADSIIKYSRLYEQALMQWRGTRQAEAIIQSSAMYNYERNQNIAEQKTKDAKVSTYLNLLLLSLLITLLLLFYIGYHRFRLRSVQYENEYRQLVNTYSSSVKELQQRSKDYELLKQNYEILKQINSDKEDEIAYETSKRLMQKHHEIERLKECIKSYERKFETMVASGLDESINQNKYIRKCHEWFKDKQAEKPNVNDFSKIQKTFVHHYPRVYDRLQEARLSNQELLVCIMILLGFDTYQITNLLGKASQSISNSKSKANYKLFGEKSTETLKKNLQMLFRCNLM